jgi:hypothetical protein
MMSFSGKEVKEQSRNLWGPTEKPRYFTVQEEFEHAITQIMRSEIGECIISMGKSPYFGEITKPAYPIVKPEAVEEYRRASARCWARSLDQIAEAERLRRPVAPTPADTTSSAKTPPRSKRTPSEPPSFWS